MHPSLVLSLVLARDAHCCGALVSQIPPSLSGLFPSFASEQTPSCICDSPARDPLQRARSSSHHTNRTDVGSLPFRTSFVSAARLYLSADGRPRRLRSSSQRLRAAHIRCSSTLAVQWAGRRDRLQSATTRLLGRGSTAGSGGILASARAPLPSECGALCCGGGTQHQGGIHGVWTRLRNSPLSSEQRTDSARAE